MKVDYHWKLIDQIAAAILIMDSEGEIHYINDHARDLLAIDLRQKSLIWSSANLSIRMITLPLIIPPEGTSGSGCK